MARSRSVARATAARKSCRPTRRRPYILGIDVGSRNLGVCVLNAFTRRTRIWNVDPLLAKDRLGKWRNVKYEERRVYKFVDMLVREFAMYLERACIVGIERQMRGRFRVIAHVLHAVIAERYGANLHCVSVDPKFTRNRMERMYGQRMTQTNTAARSEEEVYDESKALSQKLCARLMGRELYEQAETTFRKYNPRAKKTESKADDALEAMLIALGLRDYGEEAVKNFGKPRKLASGLPSNTVPMRALKFDLPPGV
jgi:hypothetical protein